MERKGKRTLRMARVVADNVSSHLRDSGISTSVWQREQTVWRRETNTSHVRIRDSGHLIPQTVPDDLGELSVYAIQTAH
jgi:hypothetical protein